LPLATFYKRMKNLLESVCTLLKTRFYRSGNEKLGTYISYEFLLVIKKFYENNIASKILQQVLFFFQSIHQ